MKLYNQTRNALRWDLSMTTYTCEPYGEVEVPDMFVMHCKKRGLPLDVTPVAPEIKANKSIEAATESAKNDEIVALQKTISEAVASEKVAKTELEKALVGAEKFKSEKIAIEVSLAESKSKYESLVADHAALTKLADEQAKELAICKQERDRALATVEQLNKPAANIVTVKDDKNVKK